MALIFLLGGGIEIHAEGDTLPDMTAKALTLKSLSTGNQVVVNTERILLVELVAQAEYEGRLAEQAAQRAEQAAQRGERSGVLQVPSMRIPRKLH